MVLDTVLSEASGKAITMIDIAFALPSLVRDVVRRQEEQSFNGTCYFIVGVWPSHSAYF